MSLTNFHCPDSPLAWKDIDDCRDCSNRCLPLPLLKALWQDEVVGDPEHYHNNPKSISVTTTQGCLLKAYLERTNDYAEQPGKLVARWSGTKLHKAIEDANQDGIDGEAEVRVQRDLSRGYVLDGCVDWVNCNGDVCDWKTVQSQRRTYDEKHAEQLQIYHDMIDMDRGVNLLAGDNYVWQLDRKGVAVHKTHTMPEAMDRCIVRAESLVEALESNDGSILPREGLGVKFFRMTLCDFCNFKDECTELGGPQEVK